MGLRLNNRDFRANCKTDKRCRPREGGIQKSLKRLDSRLRGNDILVVLQLVLYYIIYYFVGIRAQMKMGLPPSPCPSPARGEGTQV